MLSLTIALVAVLVELVCAAALGGRVADPVDTLFLQNLPSHRP